MDADLREALDWKYDPQKRNLPYASDEEYFTDLQSLLALRLTVLATFQSWSSEEDEPDGYGFPGVCAGCAGAVAYVGDFPMGPPEMPVGLPGMLCGADAHIAGRLAASELPRLRLPRLRELCGGDTFAWFCLIFALACAADRSFEELAVSLHGRADLRYPVLGVADSLYRLGREDESRLPLCIPADLRRMLFAEHAEPLPLLMRPLILRPSVFDYIAGREEPAGWPHRASLPGCGEAAPAVPALAEQAAACLAVLRDNRERPCPRLVILEGAAGSGKKTALRITGGQSGDRFFVLSPVDASFRLDAADLAAELLVRTRVYGDNICLALEQLEDIPGLYTLLSRLSPYCPCVFLLTVRLRQNLVPDGYLVHRIRFEPPTLAEAVGYWETFAAESGADAASIPCSELAAKYSLSPGRIQAAIEGALAISRTEGVPLSRALIDRAVLLGNAGRLSEIADLIPSAARWEDLVLGDIPKGMLRDVCNRVKYRHVVENGWGFRRSSYGSGISILLYGPPGTGKTMSAQVMAGELGLPLYRINLAQMISKYIGETAKNLDAVFREAKSSNVILFFDEADALFAKRTDVKNSNDRHANSESAYLLQKIEEYSGVSILATNLAQNFDEAFRRRIQYMINIPQPGPGERERLWRAYTGKNAPLAADVDFGLLARELELSGSVIRSAMLQGAYFAAAEDTPIAMAHIVRAVRLELSKLGRSEPHFMGQYR